MITRWDLNEMLHDDNDKNELMHYGVKGMRWGKHLPGVDLINAAIAGVRAKQMERESDRRLNGVVDNVTEDDMVRKDKKAGEYKNKKYKIFKNAKTGKTFKIPYSQLAKWENDARRQEINKNKSYTESGTKGPKNMTEYMALKNKKLSEVKNTKSRAGRDSDSIRSLRRKYDKSKAGRLANTVKQLEKGTRSDGKQGRYSVNRWDQALGKKKYIRKNW